MERHSHKNKENKSTGRNMTITEIFKVKKCLFNSPKSELASPMIESPLLAISPNTIKQREESPYALFHIRKRRSVGLFNGRLLDEANGSTPLKRSNIPKHKELENNVSMSSPGHTPVKLAVQKAMTTNNLIGDFSKICFLPIIQGRHPDLKSIAPQTVADLLKEKGCHNFRLIDCRYPYEYEAGHIMDAVNIYNQGDAEKDFFATSVTSGRKGKNEFLIFYCEFSSERAPGMIRFLRGRDRDLNKNAYPFLFYPELYLIEGGYKTFFSTFQELCDPQKYKAMLDKDCTEDLAFYRAKCKSFRMQVKKGKRTRSALVF